MAYTLDEFCADSRAILKTAPLSDALEQIADRLGVSRSTVSRSATAPGRCP
jgi:transcriptional regulator with XRE-family HTH domain